ncbi:unnamed protein product [Merluccius merluccius]
MVLVEVQVVVMVLLEVLVEVVVEVEEELVESGARPTPCVYIQGSIHVGRHRGVGPARDTGARRGGTL